MSENENEVKNETATVVSTKISVGSWLENVKRTACAIVGAVLCFFGVDTYYNVQLENTKANVKKVNEYITAAIDQMKAGEYVTAIETLTNAKNTILEIRDDVKDTIEETKKSLSRIGDDYANLKVAIELKDKDSIKEYALNITEKMIEITPYEKLNDSQKIIYDTAKRILNKVEAANDANEEIEMSLLNDIESLNKQIEGTN